MSFAVYVSCLAVRASQSLHASSERNVFMQSHDNFYFSLNLLSGIVTWPVQSAPFEHPLLLSLLLHSAEHPVEVNVTGWSAVASWDLSTPRSRPKALSSPWLSGISYFFATFPTSLKYAIYFSITLGQKLLNVSTDVIQDKGLDFCCSSLLL